MKHITLLFLLIFSGCILLNAQIVSHIRGDHIMTDPNNNFLVSSDIIVNEKEGFYYIYLDTINYIDENGLKQGIWLEFEIVCFTACWGCDIVIADTNIYTHYKLPNKVEYYEYPACFFIKFIGICIDNQRDGYWVAYHDNNEIWKKVLYKKGAPVGDFIVKFSDGNTRFYGKQITDTQHKVYYYNKKGVVEKIKIEESRNINFDVEMD